MKDQNKRRNISVLILLTQMELAGAQKIALMQARFLHKIGYKVVLCFFYDKSELFKSICQNEPFVIINLQAKHQDSSYLPSGLRIVRSLYRLYRIIKKYQIQVIMTLTHYSNILGILVAWLAGVPNRISSQRNRLLGFPTWFLRLDAIIVNSFLVDKMVTVSEQTKSFCIDIERMRSHKLVTIPNGVDIKKHDKFQWTKNELFSLRNELNIKQDERVVITVARLHSQKGHMYLINAATMILSIFSKVIFILVGDGKGRSEIEKKINKVGLSNNFRLLGVRQDVPKLLALSDLFVLPSIYEGMPNVILEAMAAMLPVVASDVDGIREVVVNKVTGLLVPESDAEAIYQAVITILNNNNLCYKMGLKGYERVCANFSAQVMCQRYEKLIRTILNK